MLGIITDIKIIIPFGIGAVLGYGIARASDLIHYFFTFVV